jgi:eukaryotic-like serine/threonine-protein kinase
MDPMPLSENARSSPQTGDELLTVGTTLTVTLGEPLGSSGRGTVFTAQTSNGDPVSLIWHPPGDDAESTRRATEALIAIGSPHRALAWPISVVESDHLPGWGWVTRPVPNTVEPLASVLAAPEQPPLRVLADIGAEVAEAFGALRAAGLTYRGFDLASLLVNPDTGAVVIPVVDSVGIFGLPAVTPDPVPFPAPELVRGDCLPSAASDLHSLAVLLFYLLVHGHPLEGRRVRNLPDPLDDDHLGRAPLFVFDPADASNAPPPGDPMATWWPIYPAFIRALFTQAFTAGLTDPTVRGRVTERRWYEAMIRLAGSIASCSCGAAVFWDPEDPCRPCWRCGSVPSVPPILRLPDHTIVLTDGAIICPGHLSADRDFDHRIAVVEPRSTDSGEVALRNLSGTAWTVKVADQRRQSVAPGRRFLVRDATVDFGLAQGAIMRVTPAAGP